MDLFRAHVDACRERAPAAPITSAHAAGSLIVYAPCAILVPRGFTWPVWAADRTPGGTLVHAGGPICTVLAQSDDSVSARAVLTVRELSILGMLTPGAGRRPNDG
jgi:predicted ATP-grasp superfamily ATP-dependent carboligase